MTDKQSKPMQGEICWNELMTPDAAKAKKFYGELFGWKFEDSDMGNNKTYTMFKTGGDKHGGGMMQIPHEQKDNIPPHWMAYICCDDLEKTVEKAKTLGAKITMPKTLVGDFGAFAVIEDPTGAHIAFWQSLKSC
jgi:uncharacterized protein